jgi:hypothetical protein
MVDGGRWRACMVEMKGPLRGEMCREAWEVCDTMAAAWGLSWKYDTSLC